MNDKEEKENIMPNLSDVQRPTSLDMEMQTMEMGTKNIIETIDLCTPTMDTVDVVSATSIDLEKASASAMQFERYLRLQRLISILPLYPTNDTQCRSIPLLANVPAHELIEVERVRRLTGTYQPAFNVLNHDLTIPSFFREKYHLFFGDLMERLKVDMSLLDYNYTRLNKYMKMLHEEEIRVFDLRPQELQCIEEKEYPLALEFYLQFDVNMFYMKTCSFRFARPRSMNEGLFCLHEPEARYELTACGNCGLCYPQYAMTYRLRKSIVEFSQAHKHKFVNGYETILNCSVSCHTRNIIYALTCPCGKVDYIGATTQSLHDRLQKHREHGNRIMHEFLLGQENILRDLANKQKSSELIRKDRMKLYQHSVRCPVAMQIFLDANPQYWRFIPMTLEEAERPEQIHIQRPVLSDELNWNQRSKEDCGICVEAVPYPPNGYTFSNRQIVLQTQYFHKKRDRDLPSEVVDLYHATIVAVLPEHCSNMFRYTIESLFITYADTSLNMVGNLLKVNESGAHYPLDNPWLIRGDEWCQGLLRRPQPKKIVPIENIKREV